MGSKGTSTAVYEFHNSSIVMPCEYLLFLGASHSGTDVRRTG